MSGYGDNEIRAQLAALREYVRAHPGSPRYLELARVLIDAKRTSDAERVLRAGIERGVAIDDAHRLLAQLGHGASPPAERATVDDTVSGSEELEPSARTVAHAYPDTRSDVEPVDLLRHTAKNPVDDHPRSGGADQKTTPLSPPVGHPASEVEDTSKFRKVGEHTQVEKIGRLVEPTVIVDDALPVTRVEPKSAPPVEPADDGDGETREGPVPLTLINRLNSSSEGTRPGKVTQGFSPDDLAEIEAAGPQGINFDGDETVRRALSPDNHRASAADTSSRPQAEPDRSKTSPGVVLEHDQSQIKTQMSASSDVRSGPKTQPNPVFDLEETQRKRSDEPAEKKDPETQRMEQFDLAELASFAARSDEPFLPTSIRELAEKRARADGPTEQAPSSAPDESLGGDPGNHTIRRQRPVQAAKRVPYGGADLATGSTPPSVDDSVTDSSAHTDEVPVPPKPLAGRQPPETPRSRKPGYDPDSDTNVFDKRSDGRGSSARLAEPPLLPSPRKGRASSEAPPIKSKPVVPPPQPPPRQTPPEPPPPRETSAPGSSDDRSLLRPPDPTSREAPPTAVLIGEDPRERAHGEKVDPGNPTVTTPYTPPPRWMMIAGLSLVSLLCVLILVTATQYRGAVASQVELLNEQQALVLDGNYASRVQMVTALDEPLAPQGPLVVMARSAVNLFSTPRLTEVERARMAFRTRQLFELVTIYGDIDRLGAARAALRASEPELNLLDDLKIAAALDALHEREVVAVNKMVEGISAFKQADAHWLRALGALEQRKFAVALKYAKLSVQADENHPHAYPLYVSLKAKTSEPVDGLEAYRRLVEQIRPQHISSQIGFERLRITTKKRVVEAAQNLGRLLRKNSTELGPRQRALIYEGLGRHHLAAGRLDAARSAFVSATDAVPGDPVFVEPLALLHMREFRLNRAVSLVERLSEEARVQLLPLQARLALMKGNALGAIALLDRESSPSARTFFLQGMARLELTEDLALDRGERLRWLREARTYLRKARSADNQWGEAEALYHLSRVLLNDDAKRALNTLKGLRQEASGRDALMVDQTLVFRAYARALTARKKYGSAVGEYRVALKLDPRDYLASWGLCRTYSIRLKTEKAIDACRAALQNKAYLPARRQLSVLAESFGDHGTVADALEPAYRDRTLRPDDMRRLVRARIAMGQADAVRGIIQSKDGLETPADRAYAEGRLAMAEDQLGKAQGSLEKAAKVLTGDQFVQRDYAISLMRGDRSAEAVKVLSKAMSTGGSASVALTLAEAHLNIGQWVKVRSAAQSALKRARKTHSHPRVRATALAIEAQARILGGKRKGRRLADRAIRQSLAIEPGLPAGLLARGLLLETGRRPAKAIPVYQRLVQVAPRSAQGFFRLGRLLIRKRKTRRRGMAALKRALELDPEGIWGTRAGRLLRR